ncbi:MAG: DUF4397 domain-containing protein [Thermomicrobiales bacterium]|nr:DUF4397 domain-containing protein [Thermomicrobiales bacterium]
MDARKTIRRRMSAGRAIAALLMLAALTALTPIGLAQEATPQVGGGQATPADVQLTLIGAAAALGPLDVYLDGQVVAAGLPFAAVTEPPVATNAGTRRLQIVPAGAPISDALLIGDLPFTAGQAYAIVIVGTAEHLQAASYVMDVAPVASGRARVRAINASSDAGPLDVVATTGETVAGNLAFLEASPYLPLDAAAYLFEALPTGTADIALALPEIALAPGGVYDIVFIGSAVDGTLAGVVATTVAGTPTRISRPAFLTPGTCGALDATPTASLNDVIRTAGLPLGSAQAAPVETSYSTVPVDLTTLLEGVYAIDVRVSQEQLGVSSACGEIGGVMEPDGSLALGLRELDDSGLSGVAVLRPAADNPAATDVAIYLVQRSGVIGGAATPVAKPPAASATPVA